MKKTFTILIAAIAAILMMAQPTKVMGQTYKKVTSAPSGTNTWDGEYLLVYEYTNNNTTSAWVWTGVDTENCYASASISNNVVTKPNGAVSITLASMTGGYSVKVNGGTNNGKYTSGPSKNGITFNENAVANTLTYENSATTISNNSKKFRFNSSTGQTRFRYFSSDQQTVQLYERQYTLTYATTGSGTVTGVYTGTQTNVSSNTDMVKGTKVTLTAAPADGWEFSGWSVNGTGAALSSTSTNPTTFTMGSANATVTATFSQSGSTYTVTYNANGATSGNVPEDNNEYNSGDQVTVLGNTGNLALAHYTFGGWNTQPDGQGTTYQANATFNISGSTTLYAKWDLNTHTVTLPTNDEYGTYSLSYTYNNSQVTSPTAVPYGVEVTLTYTPEEGYEDYRATWSSEQVTITDEKFTMPDEAVTINVALNQVIVNTFVFNTDNGLNALGITKPTSGAGTDLDANHDYVIGNVTMNITHGTNNNTRVWNSSGTTDLRVYDGGSLVFSVPTGALITSIEFTGNTTFNNWSDTPAQSVTFSASSTMKINTVAVSYTMSGILPPSFNPVAGTYNTNQSVQLSCGTVGADIYYTTDGSAPSGSSTHYTTGTITVDHNMTIKAIAIKDEESSDIAEAAYVLTPLAPTFDPVGGPYTGTQSVTIECNTPDVTLYYKLGNGEWTAYENPVEVSESTTLYAKATKPNWTDRESSAEYTITQPLANIAALTAQTEDDDYIVTLNDAVVTYVNGSYAYIQDASGAVLYYKSGHGLNAGDVLNDDATVTYQLRNGNPQITNLTGATTITGGEAPNPTTLTQSAWNYTFGNVLGQYFKITNATITTSNNKYYVSLNGANIQLYKIGTALSSLDLTKTYIITGFPTLYVKDENTTQELTIFEAPVAEDVPTWSSLPTPTVAVGSSYQLDEITSYITAGNPTPSVTLTSAKDDNNDDIDANLYSYTDDSFTFSPDAAGTFTFTFTATNYKGSTNANLVVTATAETYTIVFYVNGNELTSAEMSVVQGEALGTLPTPTENVPSGYSFVGWMESPAEPYFNVTTPPTMVSTSTVPGDDMILEAVFCIDSSVPAAWTLTNSAPANGEDVILAANEGSSYYAMNGPSGIEFTVAGSVITGTVPEDAIFTASVENSTNYLKQGDNYLHFNSSALKVASGTTNGAITYTASNGGFTLLANSRYMTHNTTSHGFGVSTTAGDAETMFVFKHVNAHISHSDYCTTVSPAPISFETAEYTIPTGAAYTLTSPITVPSGKTLIVPANAVFANAVPANLIIEDGGQLILPNAANVSATVKKEIEAAVDPSAKADEEAFGWYTISSSVNNAMIAGEGANTNLITTTSAPFDFDLYRYNETADEYQWENYHANNDFTHMTNGRGYLYRNATNLTATFTGTVNTGDITYKVTKTDAVPFPGINLIGNPYTHDIYKGTGGAIDNAKLSEGFYVATNSGEWIPCTDNSTPIEKNQGILVQTTETFDLTMTNVITGGPSAKANRDNIKFMVVNSQNEDVAYAIFDKGYGLNKINHRNADAQKLYINHDGENYAIAMMDDDTKVINLNFEAKTFGKYTLSLKANGNFSYLHLIDKLTGEDVDMLLEDEYSFIASPSDNENRFIVRLNYSENYESSEIFAYQSGNDIVVTGEGELQIFDVMGRMVKTQHINGVETINVPTNGVYIFRLNEKAQKIIIK